MAGITFKSFLDCVDFVTATGKPVLLRGRHGFGKSSVVYQYAHDRGMKVVERRASQMTEGDLLGLPRVNEENQSTEWLVPDWFKTCCDEPVILFIDEIDRATMEVRQGFFELTDSRKLAGHYLHENTLVFAAVNGGENTSQYQVGEMDPAELDRWTVFDLDPDVEDWLNWGKASKEVSPIILEFISENPSHLEHKQDFEPNKVYPSRRSWHRLSQALVAGDLLHGGVTSPVVVNLITAFCGLEAAIRFSDYLKNYQREVFPKDILVNGKFDLVKDFELTDHLTLIEKMSIQESFKGKLPKKQAANLAKYMGSVPSEACKKLWDCLATNGSDPAVTQHNIVQLHKELGEDGKARLVGVFNYDENKKED